MGGQQDAGVFVIVGNNGFQDIIPCRRVHARNGFIQNIQVRISAHDEDELQEVMPVVCEMIDNELIRSSYMILYRLEAKDKPDMSIRYDNTTQRPI